MRLPPTRRLPSNMTWNLCTILTLALLNVFLAQLADSNMVEGDMAVSSAQVRLDNVQHSFVIAEDSLWAEGLVPFRFEKMELVGGGFEDLFRDEDMQLIRSVLDEITEAVPCVIFREVANGHTGHCLIFTVMGDTGNSAQGCWSFVGNVGPQGGKTGQSLNLGQNCIHRGIVLHEVMHALGATHEQNRKDRDTFVKINHKNILTDARNNFQKKTEGFNTRGTPYDYESIMHYKAHDFSKNGEATITPLRQNITLRAKSELSVIDVVELAKVYDSLTSTSCFSTEMLLRYATQLETMRDRSEQLFSKCEKYRNDIEIIQGGKLHSDANFDYFKIPVEGGVTMVAGATVTACGNFGLQAVCFGPSGCRWTDESMCTVSTLETSCGGFPMPGISQAICNGETDARKCAKLDGMFIYMKGYNGDDLGIVGGSWAYGKEHTSGTNGKTLYAYCLKAK